MSDFSAPRRAELILETLGADTDFRDVVIGDLAEEFALRVSWDGPVAARRWYYRESVRVAPYLLRDLWRGLKRKDVGHFAGVIVGSSILMIALEYLLQLTVRGLELAPVTSWVRVLLSGHTRSIVLPALMLLWTLTDGAFAGYVAARLSRRAPLPGVIALGVTWTVVMIVVQGHAVPLWFRSANVAIVMAGILAGGLIGACRVSARTVTTAVE